MSSIGSIYVYICMHVFAACIHESMCVDEYTYAHVLLYKQTYAYVLMYTRIHMC